MADPKITIETVVQTAIESALKELHTCLPAVVTKVDGQTIEAQPTIQRKISGELVNLPLLVDVPLRYMKSSAFSISFPVEVGDHVLIIFSERSIDTWLESGSIQAPGDIRRHSLSDAFAFPMMYPNTDEISSFDSNNLQIRLTDNSSFINITPTGDIHLNGSVKSITNYPDLLAAFNTLKTELNTFIASYNLHMHPTAAVGPPSAPTVAGVPATADMSGAEVPTVLVP